MPLQLLLQLEHLLSKVVCNPSKFFILCFEATCLLIKSLNLLNLPHPALAGRHSVPSSLTLYLQRLVGVQTEGRERPRGGWWWWWYIQLSVKRLVSWWWWVTPLTHVQPWLLLDDGVPLPVLSHP